MMSFVGSIGFLMKGSGFEQLLEEVYPSSTVAHIMNGKQISRAVQAHCMPQSALTTLLLKESTVIDTTFLQSFYRKTSRTEIREEFLRVTSSEEFNQLSLKVQELKASIGERSRTTKLWLLYIYYVDLVKCFIYALRTSDWKLYLFCISRMLNLFAASGHSKYAKCARFHLQEMIELEQTNPYLHEKFATGMFTVKRSEKHFAGVPTDQAI